MKIGFIGLGVMGEPMCKNIIKGLKEQVFVYDINKEQVKLLVEAGAAACESIRNIAEICDVIISMVPTSRHVRAVYDEIFQADIKGRILIDMSTIEPSVTVSLSKEAVGKGAVMLDCPVVKSKAAAIKGELGIYISGDEAAYKKVKPILECMGKNQIYLGESGNAITMKICHNLLVAYIQNSVNEVLKLTEAKGIDIDKVREAFSYGGGQNAYLDMKKDSLKNKDYTVAFSVENMYKDINIADSLAKDLNINLRTIDIVKDVYERTLEKSQGKADFSITFETVKEDDNEA